jgi:hypothetical protein
VAALAGGNSGDGQALARMGVYYVLVPRPARDPVTPVLDAAPELTMVSRTGAFGVWRLVTPAGRLMLVDGPTITPLRSGEFSAKVRIPPGTGPRTLLLAEPADGGWHAALNGSGPKRVTVDGWAQGYEIPAAGGEFTLSRGMALRHIWLVLQAAGALAVVVLALPGSQIEGLAAPIRDRHRSRGRRTRKRGRAPAGRRRQVRPAPADDHAADEPSVTSGGRP